MVYISVVPSKSMDCESISCDNKLEQYRIDKCKVNIRSKHRFCPECVNLRGRGKYLSWPCLECGKTIESDDYRKIYCNDTCRLNAKYIRNKPRLKQYQRNQRKLKLCQVCKRDVTQDDKSYPYKICYECRTAFVTKYKNLKCLLCQKRLNKASLYCSKNCRVLSSIEMERRRNELL